MLTPTLDELLALRHQAQGMGLVSNLQVATPLSGLYASVFRGQGMDFDEVREYRYGDEIRNLDWRVTARMGKPFLKVYREERERSVMLCIDIGAHMAFGTQGTFKSVQAARVAALLGWSAQCHGDRVGGLLFGQGREQFFRPNRSQRAFSQLLRALTTLSDDTVAPAPTALGHALQVLSRSTATGALLFIIADLNQIEPAELQKTLTLVHQRHAVVLIAIDDLADYQLPAIGRLCFVNAAGEQVQVNLNNASGRRNYRLQWEQRRQELIQVIRQLNINFFTVATDQDVYQSVLTGLRQRAEQQRAHR